MRVAEGNFDDPQVVALLDAHIARARAETGRGSAHALDAGGLKAPGIRFWTIWDRDRLLGLGALKTLSSDHGEIKSMHTAEAARGQGVASAMLAHIVEEAQGMGMTCLSLETGSWDYFGPARAFYRRHGFVECAPFGDYRPDVNSVFMTCSLDRASVRPYAEKDFETVTQIWLSSWQSTGVDAPVTLAELRERWLRELAERKVHVAVVKDEVVGFVALKTALLDQLFIAPAHQSRRIGKMLLEFAKRQMPEGFELYTALHSRAPAFYEREGLERGKTGIHPRLGHEIVTYHWRP